MSSLTPSHRDFNSSLAPLILESLPQRRFAPGRRFRARLYDSEGIQIERDLGLGGIELSCPVHESHHPRYVPPTIAMPARLESPKWLFRMTKRRSILPTGRAS